MNSLVEIEPASWPVLLGYPKAATEVIDADIATVSGAADEVLRGASKPPYSLHIEFVSGHDSAALSSTLLMRNSLLGHRHVVMLPLVPEQTHKWGIRLRRTFLGWSCSACRQVL